MPPHEAAQLALGLVLPFLILQHVGGTRISHALGGIEANYARVIYGLWIANPVNGARQVVALLVAWLHSCWAYISGSGTEFGSGNTPFGFIQPHFCCPFSPCLGLLRQEWTLAPGVIDRRLLDIAAP
jgi:hypothetical protein